MQSLPHPLRRHPVTSESVRCPTATRNDLCQRSHRPSSQTANSWRQLRTPRQGNFKQTRVKPKAPKINKKPSPHESQCPSPILITLSIFIPFLDFFNPARQAAKKNLKKNTALYISLHTLWKPLFSPKISRPSLGQGTCVPLPPLDCPVDRVDLEPRGSTLYRSLDGLWEGKSQ